MKADIREELKRELTARGFNGPVSPNGTMTLDDDYLAAVGVGELLELLVARRETIFRSGDIVGMDTAKMAYEDVGTAVEALKIVVERLVLPT